MQLGGLPTSSDAADIGAAMRSARGFGQRPAVVVLRPAGRQEQGFGTWLQWAAKISHWLETDHGLGPGDRLGLSSPAGWLPAAAALAAWWSGLQVTVGGNDAPVTIVHEHAPAPASGDVAVVGDAFDGRPVEPAGGGEAEGAPGGAALTELVQLFPDQPPRERARPAAPALSTNGGERTQQELLERARAQGEDGAVGLEADTDPAVWLPAVALRPLLTGRTTVVLDRVSREVAGADAVSRWL